MRAYELSLILTKLYTQIAIIHIHRTAGTAKMFARRLTHCACRNPLCVKNIRPLTLNELCGTFQKLLSVLSAVVSFLRHSRIPPRRIFHVTIIVVTARHISGGGCRHRSPGTFLQSYLNSLVTRVIESVEVMAVEEAFRHGTIDRANCPP